jgi:pyruvate/2-oxoglutarate dehydrogenase complex dihydrolipoamide dehydrogenase (E3) component
MADTIETDICVIGAGSGGLSVAAGASQLGARTVLIEKGKMGGDCLNYGCVPSKALIAAGHAAHAIRASDRFGIAAGAPAVDFRGVHDHVHGVIAAIAPNDSVERFTGLGVTVLQAAARFTGPDEVEADGTRVRAKYFVVATGSSAGVPPIPGLDTVPYLTNETVFDLTEGPEHLIVIGGGPIGCELAQAHRRLGAEVTVLEMFAILGKDDPEVTGVVKRRLREEGIALREGIKITRVAPDDAGVSVEIEQNGVSERIAGSHVLVAAGRSANVDGLNLEAAGVKYSKKGVEVDARLRSSNKRVYAIGDAAGGYQFTHVANYHAGIVIRNMLFWLPAKANSPAIPWVTYTDPEIAHVGKTEAQAKKELNGDIRVLRFPLHESDRAQAERETDGLIKVVTDKRGRVLGASIAAARAGELLLPWVIAVEQKQKIGRMASIIAPYPTLSEVSKRVAGSYFVPSLFSEKTRKVVRFLLKF